MTMLTPAYVANYGRSWVLSTLLNMFFPQELLLAIALYCIYSYLGILKIGFHDVGPNYFTLTDRLFIQSLLCYRQSS